MNGDWRYYLSDYFPSDWHCRRGELTRLDLGVLDDIVNRIPPKPEHVAGKKPKNKPASLMLTFPFDTQLEGPLIVEPNPDWKLFHHMDTSIEFLWTPTERPGRGINVTSVEIQQGATTSSHTSGAHIAFDTPYIGLPDDTYDFLFLATQPQRIGACSSMWNFRSPESEHRLSGHPCKSPAYWCMNHRNGPRYQTR